MKTQIIVVLLVSFCLCHLLPAQSLAVSQKHGDMTKIQSRPDLSLKEYLRGIKYAFIELSEEEQQLVDEKGSIMLDKFAHYLSDLGFEKVAMTTDEKEAILNTAPSLCDMTQVKLTMTYMPKPKNYFTDHIVRYKTCRQDSFYFHSGKVLLNDNALLDNIYDIWRSFYSHPIQYNELNRLRLPFYGTPWNETKAKQRFDQGNVDQLEGVYKKFVSDSKRNKYRVAIIKDQRGTYDVVYLSGATNYIDWQEGELMGKISPTGSGTLSEVTWYRPDKTSDQELMSVLGSDNMLSLSHRGDDTKVKYYKEYPKNTFARTQNAVPLATGSSIALSTEGHFVTNYHVIDGGKYIEVEVERDGIRRLYRATVLVSDKDIDLAILKIDDPDFSPFDDLPYNFLSKLAPVGSEVFTLGYPLTNSMGKEVKLTNGIISAHTGYNGDATSYQIQAPVQPGNSGGPLFDYEGNLIGIIKAKHNVAENATYAIKSLNLLNLVYLLPEKIQLPNNPSQKGQPLFVQKKVFDKFVFFVKVYN